ncbi:MAG: circadian clock protein KaiC, partial [Candidatus Competibacteraceae bacterium]|nr:circadian clock protein KaiC [Candidatus Competibacteraceae bacterium]
MHQYQNLTSPEKVPTGIEGFEHITIGGLPTGRTCLVAGSSGSGKTLLAMEFLHRGFTQFGRKGVFVTMEERAPDLV